MSLHEILDEAMPVVPTPNLTPMAALLCELGYTQHAREQVLGYARDLGTLEGCIYVDPDDRVALDELLEASWPAVQSTSHRWDDDRTQGRPSKWTLHRPAAVAAFSVFLADALDRARLVDAPPEAGLELTPPELEADAPDGHDEADELYYAAWADALPSSTLELEPFQS